MSEPISLDLNQELLELLQTTDRCCRCGASATRQTKVKARMSSLSRAGQLLAGFAGVAAWTEIQLLCPTCVGCDRQARWIPRLWIVGVFLTFFGCVALIANGYGARYDSLGFPVTGLHAVLRPVIFFAFLGSLLLGLPLSFDVERLVAPARIKPSADDSTTVVVTFRNSAFASDQRPRSDGPVPSS